LYGDRGANLLAGAGRDRLYGRGGDDVLLLSGSACADGGAGNDVYLVDPLLAGDHVTIADGDDPDRNVIFLGMDRARIVSARRVGQALVLTFDTGATLTLQTPLDDSDPRPGWATSPERFAWLTRDGWLLRPVLTDDTVELQARHAPQALAVLLAHSGVQRMARLKSLNDQAAVFNFGDGNDTLTGHARRKNLFNLGSGDKTVTGGMRDDIFVLNALSRPAPSGIDAYDSETRRILARQFGTWRYRLEGGEGNDTLRVDTPFADSAYLGYRIDLAQGRIGLIARDGSETVDAGHLRSIENVVVSSDAEREADTRHVLLGDERGNLLAGSGLDEIDGRGGDDVLSVSGRARALGGSGNDTIHLSGSAFADGGDGQDSYWIDALKAGDRVTLHDSGAARQPGENDSLVRINVDLQHLRDWQIVRNDLVLTLQSGGTITVKAFVQPDDRPTSHTRVSFLTRDGFLLSPDVPTQASEGISGDFKLAARYIKTADAVQGSDGRGVSIDLQRQEIGALPPTPRVPLKPGSRYRLQGVGTAHDDILTGPDESPEGAILRGLGGNDALTARAGGTLLCGDEGADRYRIDRQLDGGEAVYVDNFAEDGVEDTLHMTAILPGARLLLARWDDDLLLSVRPDPAGMTWQPQAVVLGYFRHVERRHLALAMRTGEGGETLISASELEARALNEAIASPRAPSARIHQLIERMAGFATDADTGMIVPPRPVDPPVGVLAAA